MTIFSDDPRVIETDPDNHLGLVKTISEINLSALPRYNGQRLTCHVDHIAIEKDDLTLHQAFMMLNISCKYNTK